MLIVIIINISRNIIILSLTSIILSIEKWLCVSKG